MLFRLAALSALLGSSASAASAEKAYDTYEVWGCDQSNSVEGQDALGVAGSYLWIWDESDVNTNVASGTTPPAKSCLPDVDSGPCDMNKVFPTQTLTDSASGKALADLPGFGRWHGITKDPQNMYVTANVFVPGGGYLGIVDAETRGAVALFRVTEMKYSAPSADDPSATKTTRSVHMSFWNHDGSAIIIHNLAGKAVERINIVRDATSGKITSATFDKSATVGMGRNMAMTAEASYFEGNNAFGVPLIGAVTGSYDDADLGDLTPTGHCKENGCDDAEGDLVTPGRPNNVGICPVISPKGLVFNTFGGGGLIVLDSTKTPMSIVGAYGNSDVYGAGVCGESVGDRTYFTSGVSASGAGAMQSMWALYAFHEDDFMQGDGTYTSENSPSPDFFFDFPGTATGGRTEGVPQVSARNADGDATTMTAADRKDAHDLAGTIDGKYVHVVDRIQNVLDVFDSATNEHVSTIHLDTATGKDDDTAGPCGAASITDGGADFPTNDVAADFISPTPDGRYMMLSLRGPAPASASHAAQGSCPGVGVVELTDGGKSGMLVGVLRATNTLPDNIDVVDPSNGSPYAGEERSDVHDVVVVFKKSSDDAGATDGGTKTDTEEPESSESADEPEGSESADEPEVKDSSSAGIRTTFAALAAATIAVAVLI